MKPGEIMDKIDEILGYSSVAVLSTVNEEGKPCVRWMTPTTLKGRPGALFALTTNKQDKLCHLNKNSNVEWMLQLPSLNEVINLKGRVNIVDVPSLKMEVMENLGSRLSSFWRVSNRDLDDFIVLETIIDEATYFLPLEGVKKKVEFSQGVENE